MKYGLPTPPLSPILQPQESTNSITKRPWTTRFNSSYLTVEDLYARFHGKPKPSSLSARQVRLQPALSFGQMRITSYFKPAKLAPARKHVDLKEPVQLVRNGDLALSKRAPFSPASASHPTQKFTSSDKSHRRLNHCSKGAKRWPFANNLVAAGHHTCRRCTQQFVSRNQLHRHLRHCFSCTQPWSPASTAPHFCSSSALPWGSFIWPAHLHTSGELPSFSCK